MQPSWGWQQATAANNWIAHMVPDAPRGHPLERPPPHGARVQGNPGKRLAKKTKALGKFAAGTPTAIPDDFFAAMPKPKGAVAFGKQWPKRGGGKSRPAKRPDQQSIRAKKAAGAALVVRDGLDSSVPVNELAQRQGGAKPAGRLVGFPVSKGKTLMIQ